MELAKADAAVVDPKLQALATEAFELANAAREAAVADSKLQPLATEALELAKVAQEEVDKVPAKGTTLTLRLQQSIINYQKKERKYQQKELETQNLTLKLEKEKEFLICKMQCSKWNWKDSDWTNQNANDRP